MSSLFKILINHSKTELTLLDWLKWSSQISFLLIFLIISLVTLPSSFFTELINRHDGFYRKCALWCFSVKKAGVCARHLMLSCRLMSLSILFASKFIDVSNLVALVYMFLWRCHEEVLFLPVQAFYRYYLLCLRKQKRLVTFYFWNVLI